MDKGRTFKILDKGYVRLIDFMGSDELIVESARMSTGKGFIGWEPAMACTICGLRQDMKNATEEDAETDGGVCITGVAHEMEMTKGDASLLETLYSNKHATPFESPELMLEIKAPIMVFREWHRHRTQSYNEFSARYAQMPDEHYIPELERIVRQSSLNKQGGDGAFDRDTAVQVVSEIERQQSLVYDTYDAWVEAGVAKEVARINTPVSRYSKMRAKTDLRNWLGFLILRMAPSAQYEIRMYANAVAEIIKNLFPRSYGLFEEYTLFATTFSRTEMKILKEMLKSSTIGPTELAIDLNLDSKWAKSLLKKI